MKNLSFDRNLCEAAISELTTYYTQKTVKRFFHERSFHKRIVRDFLLITNQARTEDNPLLIFVGLINQLLIIDEAYSKPELAPIIASFREELLSEDDDGNNALMRAILQQQNAVIHVLNAIDEENKPELLQHRNKKNQTANDMVLDCKNEMLKKIIEHAYLSVESQEKACSSASSSAASSSSASFPPKKKEKKVDLFGSDKNSIVLQLGEQMLSSNFQRYYNFVRLVAVYPRETQSGLNDLMTQIEQQLEQESPEAYALQGLIFQYGLGVERNLENAEMFFQKAQQKGLVIAMSFQAVMYVELPALRRGEGRKTAAKLLEEASALGEPVAMYHHAFCKKKGVISLELNYDRIWPLIINASMLGNVLATAFLAMYGPSELSNSVDNHGKFLSKQFAVRLLKFAVDFRYLSSLEAWAKTSDKKPTDVIRLYRQGYELGNIINIIEISKIYFFGKGVKENQDKAFQLIFDALPRFFPSFPMDIQYKEIFKDLPAERPLFQSLCNSLCQEENPLMLAARNYPDAFYPMLESIETMDFDRQVEVLKLLNYEGKNVLQIIVWHQPQFVMPLLSMMNKFEPRQKADIIERFGGGVLLEIISQKRAYLDSQIPVEDAVFSQNMKAFFLLQLNGAFVSEERLAGLDESLKVLYLDSTKKIKAFEHAKQEKPYSLRFFCQKTLSQHPDRVPDYLPRAFFGAKGIAGSVSYYQSMGGALIQPDHSMEELWQEFVKWTQQQQETEAASSIASSSY